MKEGIQLDTQRLFIEVIAKLQATNQLPPEGSLARRLTEMMIFDVMDATIRVLVEDHGIGEIVGD